MVHRVSSFVALFALVLFGAVFFLDWIPARLLHLSGSFAFLALAGAFGVWFHRRDPTYTEPPDAGIVSNPSRFRVELPFKEDLSSKRDEERE
jgi:hypothetical protein